MIFFGEITIDTLGGNASEENKSGHRRHRGAQRI